MRSPMGGPAPRFINTIAEWSVFDESILNRIVAQGLRAPHSSWVNVRAIEGDFTRAVLIGADLRGMIVVDADFSLAQLQGADLRGWKMYRHGEDPNEHRPSVSL